MENKFTIYTKFLNFQKYMYVAIHSFPKEYKFSLGQQIIDKSWETMDIAISANLAENKDKYIEITNLLNSFDKLKTRIRMAHELKVINDKKYAYILKHIVSIEKDILNWLSWAKSTKPK
ncbi:MAG TPA: four helix bundle protein [bacterium]|nr:four helix bundle protein [bacterium]